MSEKNRKGGTVKEREKNHLLNDKQMYVLMIFPGR